MCNLPINPNIIPLGSISSPYKLGLSNNQPGVIIVTKPTSLHSSPGRTTLMATLSLAEEELVTAVTRPETLKCREGLRENLPQMDWWICLVPFD